MAFCLGLKKEIYDHGLIIEGKLTRKAMQILNHHDHSFLWKLIVSMAISRMARLHF